MKAVGANPYLGKRVLRNILGRLRISDDAAQKRPMPRCTLPVECVKCPASALEIFLQTSSSSVNFLLHTLSRVYRQNGSLGDENFFTAQKRNARSSLSD